MSMDKDRHEFFLALVNEVTGLEFGHEDVGIPFGKPGSEFIISFKGKSKTIRKHFILYSNGTVGFETYYLGKIVDFNVCLGDPEAIQKLKAKYEAHSLF